jgi:hypothetical protein
VQLKVTTQLEPYWLEISGSVAETFRMNFSGGSELLK